MKNIRKSLYLADGFKAFLAIMAIWSIVAVLIAPAYFGCFGG